MIRPGLKANVGFCYAALVFAILFLIGTGLVQGWGNWYSDNVNYREQTAALLHGSMALHDTPASLKLDQVWYNHQSQQVWGLAVPVWRLPFELLAKIFGQPAFPDRFAFGAALMLLAFLALKILLPPSSRPSPLLGEKVREGRLSGLAGDRATPSFPFRVAAVLVLLLFPPLLTLCRFHFDVYEEAAAYAYLGAIGLFLGLVAFIHAPTRTKYFSLTLLAGFAPFIRPTVGAFGLATLLIALFLSLRAKFSPWQSAGGLLLFAIGGLLLFVTNQIRFGSGLEFGHSLNLNAFPIWFYTRFYNPFGHEPIISAARELFGGMFHLGGQSKTPRWRNDYLTTFDLSYLILPVLCGILWLAIRKLRREKPLDLPLETKLAFLWSGIAFAILTIFYLRQPVMSSRYVLDFAPVFAVALAGSLIGLENIGERLLPGRRVWSWCCLGMMVLWLGWENCSANCTAIYTRAIDRTEMLEILNRPIPELKALPRGYAAGTEMGQYSLGFNGASWRKDGHMPTATAFYVDDAQYLKLTVGPTNTMTGADYNKVQAKIGLEFLERQSITEQGYAHVINFKPPKRPVYQHGIQVAFVAYVDKTNAAASMSPLILYRIEWRQTNTVTNAVPPSPTPSR